MRTAIIFMLIAFFLLSIGCIQNVISTPTPTAKPISQTPTPELEIKQIVITGKPRIQSTATAVPTPVAKKKVFVPPDKSSCEKAKGLWLTNQYGDGCYMPTTDQGKKCTDSSQCQGYCISHLKSATSGFCAATIPLAACDYVIDNSQVKGTVCA